MSMIFEKLIRPLLFGLPAETAHEVGIDALRLGLVPAVSEVEFTGIERFGLHFRNPLGIAAGFDKNGVVVDRLAELGFGFVEVGTVTLEPQPGNERPRLFRLTEDKALINRLGFNNQGASIIADRLSKIKRKCIVGVNIGKNRDVPIEDSLQNYLECYEKVFPVADYIALNVSSPNTPNLRDLQRAKNLEELLVPIQARNRFLGAKQKPKPLLVKIAPDLSEIEIEAIVDVCTRLDVSGIIATNTTLNVDGLRTAKPDRFGIGGLSGKPLAKRSNEVISSIHRYSKGKMPIIGVGGIFTAEDAFEKIAAGAWLLQAYTGFIYLGPSFAHDVNAGLLRILAKRGFDHLGQAIGSAVQ